MKNVMMCVLQVINTNFIKIVFQQYMNKRIGLADRYCCIHLFRKIDERMKFNILFGIKSYKCPETSPWIKSLTWSPWYRILRHITFTVYFKISQFTTKRHQHRHQNGFPPGWMAISFSSHHLSYKSIKMKRIRLNQNYVLGSVDWCILT